ncbi:hypothetical protein K7X08_030742 [Anisodus acutangulus]|uniref:Protein kinase domain-containing protein n=1 Tax=Anisodus acutangulus TaxID=402998 RepID=A0A9Q1M366_9SOLA|nr:hypothetical protein K7X08_030742 [Anisodus acutangulus]
MIFNLHQVQGNSKSNCTDEFECGSLGVMKFPFTNSSNPKCGLYKFDCLAKPYPKFELGGHKYDALVKKGDFFLLSDPELQKHLDNKNCNSFNTKFSFPNSPLISFQIVPNLTLYRCKHSHNNTIQNQKTTDSFFRDFERYNKCEDFNVYYRHPKISLGNTSAKIYGILPKHCSLVQLPIPLPTSSKSHSSDLFELLTSSILLDWELSKDCHYCLDKGGKCLIADEHKFRCSKGERGQSKLKMIILASVLGGVGLILVSSIVIFSIWCRKRKKDGSTQFRRHLEVESRYFGFQVPVFTYAELKEATNNFDPSNELGDGGFGTVYYGELYDGRQVAVKCLYEHNCKRMQQFINEIEILTRLRHQNLVSLYGCTSRRSRELLLVYEYIPNATVADHLHGDRSAEGLLTWPIRLNIAVETAGALAYLHASDLTDKSDVYSFGVVLIELVSSMPAVDISRHKHEINLANLAINRIQRCAFDELIDPSLGFASDTLVKKMTISVAKLAFRCLQLEKDIRPTMDEVLDILRKIQGGEFHQNEKTLDGSFSFNLVKSKSVNIPPFPSESDEVALLKKVKFLSSSDTNSEIWISGSTITSTIQAKGSSNSTCPKSLSCGNLTDLSFPFSLSTQPECGIMLMSGCDAKPHPRIQLLPGGDWYYALVTQYSYTKKNEHFAGYEMYNGCKGFSIYYKHLGNDNVTDIQADNLPANCSLIRLPIQSLSSNVDLFNLLGPKILVEWKLSDDCYQCHYGGGQCRTDRINKFHCSYPKSPHAQDAKMTRRKFGLTLGVVFGGLGLVMICLVVYFIWCSKKRKFSPSRFLSTKKLSDIFKHDVEGGSTYFGVPVFSYSELEEATNDFNSSRVLGDGGFGTVYYGKLKDGREVAVKRLSEHNCKRMQQFVNEIEILTRLRHNNLVTLYGCTSWRSRELLLVYEYIPNGTPADHLHGDKAKDRSLVWPICMNIAIETAGALAYLHASDVIHCDVKSNNILLDHNFSVKIADLGFQGSSQMTCLISQQHPGGPLAISIQSITNVTS